MLIDNCYSLSFFLSFVALLPPRIYSKSQFFENKLEVVIIRNRSNRIESRRSLSCAWIEEKERERERMIHRWIGMRETAYRREHRDLDLARNFTAKLSAVGV